MTEVKDNEDGDSYDLPYEKEPSPDKHRKGHRKSDISQLEQVSNRKSRRHEQSRRDS